MFLNLPRSEALEHYPTLAGHYALVEAIDRHGEDKKRTLQRRAQELKQAQQRIAAAIEQGKALQFKAGKLDVAPGQVVPEPQRGLDRSKDRGREPQR